MKMKRTMITEVESISVKQNGLKIGTIKNYIDDSSGKTYPTFTSYSVNAFFTIDDLEEIISIMDNQCERNSSESIEKSYSKEKRIV